MKLLKFAVIPLASVALFACERTPEAKKAAVAEEMREEQREHAKEMGEIRRDNADPAEKAKQLAEETGEHAKEMTELEKQAFITDAKQELERMDRNIEALKTRAAKLTGAAKDDVMKQLDVLEKKYDVVKDDIDNAKVKSNAELIRIRDTFEASLRDIEKSYNDLAAKAG